MKSLDKVFKIIDLIKNKGGMRLKDISGSLNIYKSTAYRIVSELVSEGYIRKDSESKKYNLGLKFLEVSRHLIKDIDLAENAEESTDRLNKLTKETIHLAKLIGDQAIYINKRESQHNIRMYSQIGKNVPLHCTGVGKVIVAFQTTPRRRDKLIENIDFRKYTDNTITNKDAFLRELEKIKKEGFAVDREEHEENIICIAAPIRDYTGNVIASISITAISYRLNLDELLVHKDILIEECEKVSRKMGYKY